jgi:hypothetical protein
MERTAVRTYVPQQANRRYVLVHDSVSASRGFFSAFLTYFLSSLRSIDSRIRNFILLVFMFSTIEIASGVVGKVSNKDQAPPGCRWVEIYSADNEGKLTYADRDEMRRKDDFYQFLKSFFSWKILREVFAQKDEKLLSVEVLVPLTSLEAAPEGPDRRRSFLGTCCPVSSSEVSQTC